MFVQEALLNSLAANSKSYATGCTERNDSSSKSSQEPSRTVPNSYSTS